MSEISTWEQTAGGMMRNGGLAFAPGAVQSARDMMDRSAAKREFEDAWGDVLPVQRALAERGWTGAWVFIEGPLRPPELAPLYAAAAMASTPQGGYGPGGRDPLVAETEARERQRWAQAQARMDPIMKTIG